ncbi:MAG: hypothetical protein MUD01_01500 [Chloroflexaceae bacterium]|jgi:glycosyltransferase involved in cell wall biosynthesis|nr:hypothetical protein [Chloroflexaceae bacterium]
MQVRVFPTSDPLYHVFYLAGLHQLFGRGAVRYSCEGFPILHSYCMAFRVEPAGTKIYIDARDGADLDPPGLAWADVYAKVNVDWASIPPTQARQVVAIGPNFGLRYWNLPATAWNALHSYMLVRQHLTNHRRHLALFWQQYRLRLPLAAYQPAPGEADYVFTLSTIWPNDPQCNQYRANFVAACRSLAGLRFEGGLVARNAEEARGWEEFLVAQPIEFPIYLERIKRSTVVFNTPAVHGCHGWKLGEFLALGKAIISTPLLRAMPAPLVHGDHVHFVDGSVEATRAAVEQICRDNTYRRHLEQNARAYYLEHVQPRRAIERMLAVAEERLVPCVF